MSDNVRYFLKNFLNLVFLRIISRIIPIVMMTYYIIPIIGFSSFGKLEFAKILNYFLKIKPGLVMARLVWSNVQFF